MIYGKYAAKKTAFCSFFDLYNRNVVNNHFSGDPDGTRSRLLFSLQY